jgi:DNA replicative helicase MCM subunit Mcm2 (Cdc46/Mcm family)
LVLDVTNETVQKILFKNAEKFLERGGYKEFVMQHTPDILTIEFMDIAQHFNCEQYTEEFFNSLSNPDFFLFVKSMLAYVCSNWHPKNKIVVEIKNMHKRLGLMEIKKISAKHFGKLLSVSCIIRSSTEKLSKISGFRWHCLSCEFENGLFRYNSDFISRSSVKIICPKCASRRYKEISKLRETIQRIKVEETTETSEVTQKTHSIYGQMRNEIINTFANTNLNVGDRCILTGYLVDNPSVKGTLVTSYFLEIVEVERDSEVEVVKTVTKDEEKKILEEVKQPYFIEKLQRSIAPKIQGYDDAKTSLILQELSGINQEIRVWNDPTIKKQFIHIIFAGDPATAKTQLVKFMQKVSPKMRFASGDQSSIAGLIGSVYQDSMMANDWTLSAGALSLANGGTIGIDELNKFDKNELSRLNQILTDYAISIDKAKINTTLYTEVKLLGIMNPMGDEWDSKSISRQKILQLNLKKAFITRITMIFPFFEDDLTQDKDVEIALLRQSGEKVEKDIYPLEFIKKFFIYAKRKKVRWDNHYVVKKKMEFYNKIFKPKIKSEILDIDDGEGYSRTELPSKMRVFDSYEAILSGLARLNIDETEYCQPKESHYELVDYFLEKYYLNMFYKKQESYWEGVGIKTAIIKFKQKDKVDALLDHMKSNPDGFPENVFEHQTLFDWWNKKYQDSNKHSFDRLIEKLKMSGDIYEIKSGFYRVM